MGLRPLGKKWIHKIETLIGESIVAASGKGSYWHNFTTAKHKHGLIHAHSHEIKWRDDCPRLASCRLHFGPATTECHVHRDEPEDGCTDCHPDAITTTNQ